MEVGESLIHLVGDAGGLQIDPDGLGGLMIQGEHGLALGPVGQPAAKLLGQRPGDGLLYTPLPKCYLC